MYRLLPSCSICHARDSSLPKPRRSTLSEWLILFPYEIDQKENLIGVVLLNNLLYKFIVLYF